jgi:hypothetical protein
MLDDVQMEILLNNTASTRFSPVTGVLQVSILSSFLYSICINHLLLLLCSKPLSENPPSTQMTSFLTCLLYADDAVLIADKDQMIDLLKACEDHSYRLGIDGIQVCHIRSNPKPIRYTLHNEAIPSQSFLSLILGSPSVLLVTSKA